MTPESEFSPPEFRRNLVEIDPGPEMALVKGHPFPSPEARKFALLLITERARLDVTQEEACELLRGPRGGKPHLRTWGKWEGATQEPQDWLIPLIEARLKSLTRAKARRELDALQK